MLSRFHLITERSGRTDRRTDEQICYTNIARQYSVCCMTRDKNRDLPCRFELRPQSNVIYYYYFENRGFP